MQGPGTLPGIALPPTFEEWWASLEEGRKSILLGDKWMMARNAYNAGLGSSKK